MITAQEFKNKYSDTLKIENYIDDQLKKCNLEINLMQFKNILTLDKLNLLIQKYEEAEWEVTNISKHTYTYCELPQFTWTRLKLIFKVPQ